MLSHDFEIIENGDFSVQHWRCSRCGITTETDRITLNPRLKVPCIDSPGLDLDWPLGPPTITRLNLDPLDEEGVQERVDDLVRRLREAGIIKDET